MLCSVYRRTKGETKKMSDNTKPVISIVDRSRKRIRIHRITLHLLGDPEYIQLLVNPVSKTIAIRKGSVNDPLSLRVYPIDSEKDSFEIRSSNLMRSLKMVFTKLEEGNSYRIYGEMGTNNEVALFRLDDYEKEEADL